MKRIQNHELLRDFVRKLALAAGLLTGAAASAQYQLRPIPFLPTAESSEARGVNFAGRAAGIQALPGGTYHGYVFDGVSLDDFVTIDSLSGDQLVDQGVYAINDFGIVVGGKVVTGGLRHAFAYDSIGAAFFDITLDNTTHDEQSGARAINNLNQIAGGHHLPSGSGVTFRPVLWPSDWASVTAISDGLGSEADVRGINEAGFVVGKTPTAVWGRRPYVWNGSAVVELPTFSPAGNEDGRANDINNLNQIVGYAHDRLGTNLIRPVLWSGGVMTNLGEVSPSGQIHEAHAINDASQVVGTSGGVRAFLWEAGTMHDLNDLIPPGSGWVLQVAYAISETGFIAGYGDPPGGTTKQAFVLAPCALTILTQPASQSVSIGDTLYLHCDVVGAGPMSIAWLKDGLPIPSNTPCGSTYTASVVGGPSSAEATLTITTAGPADAASYSAVVTGACGMATSDVAVVTIACPGDIDGDHQVGQGDLAALLASYNLCAGDPGYNGLADLDCSGCVDQADLAALLARYNEVCP